MVETTSAPTGSSESTTGKKLLAIRVRSPRIPQSSPYGYLGQLPRELRDEIYAMLFSKGHIALTRTSKALHADTEAALYKYGVYRLIIDDKLYYDLIDLALPYEEVIRNVQNVRIHILPPSKEPYHQHDIEYTHDFKSLSLFIYETIGSMTEPKTCTVKFTFATYTPFMEYTLESLVFLNEFEHIHVEIFDGVWSTKDGISKIFTEDEMVKAVKWRLTAFDDDEREGLTITRVKRPICFNL
ncbi:MAG: hypothetical protein HETSPECPRED_010351 [Heterodermia speciosa]|uniref:Uncharacterized protein n=1 Tax=Heterodermia speciosa TaxID=116794 RepID=A0A8H3G8G0_9LECA|nr:MAG: hypothetical protein HETSPECPRED_010351 [Heterodermia speciosa]